MGINASESWPKHPFLHHNAEARNFTLEPKYATARNILGALTPKQREIVEHLAAGLTREETAQKLRSSPHLVKRMMYAQSSVERFSGVGKRVGSVQIAIAALGVSRGANKRRELPDIDQLINLFDALQQIDNLSSFVLGLRSYGLKNREIQTYANLKSHEVDAVFIKLRELFSLPAGVSQNIIIEKYAYLLALFCRPEVLFPVLVHKNSPTTIVGMTIQNAALNSSRKLTTP